ncbi:hypothetical protein ACH4UY_34615 [Streptomyces longwoodensis]|uniref:hypothetical protein n=1 Tax=Streptomyces longwoodensis TaxID=68231 RepID=UPI0037A12ECF
MNAREPAFDPVKIDTNTGDGYWIHAADLDGDGRIDLAVSGLTTFGTPRDRPQLPSSADG